jgi:hypothetical protein
MRYVRRRITRLAPLALLIAGLAVGVWPHGALAGSKHESRERDDRHRRQVRTRHDDGRDRGPRARHVRRQRRDERADRGPRWERGHARHDHADRSHHAARPRVAFGVRMASVAPAGYAYFDPYCDRRFRTLDGYAQHLHGRRHPHVVHVVDEDCGVRVASYRRGGGTWVRFALEGALRF